MYANTLRSALILCTLKHHDKTVVYHQRDRLTADYLGTLTSLMAKSLIGMRFRFVIANSASTASTTPRGAKHIYILPSSVGSEFYKLKLPPSDSVIEIVMVGRLAPWKGQAEFIKALVVLKDELRLTNWRVRIVGGALFGESEYEDQLKTLINDNNLSDYVQLTGHVDNVSSIVGASHILVHSSTVPEPFGQVVAQGMASGRAIVAANAGGPAEMLVHNESALLIDPENALTFANSLGQLIASSTLRARLGSSARLAAEGFRIAQVQNQLRVYLSDIVRKAGN